MVLPGDCSAQVVAAVAVGRGTDGDRVPAAGEDTKAVELLPQDASPYPVRGLTATASAGPWASPTRRMADSRAEMQAGANLTGPVPRWVDSDHTVESSALLDQGDVKPLYRRS